MASPAGRPTERQVEASCGDGGGGEERTEERIKV